MPLTNIINQPLVARIVWVATQSNFGLYACPIFSDGLIYADGFGVAVDVEGRQLFKHYETCDAAIRLHITVLRRRAAERYYAIQVRNGNTDLVYARLLLDGADMQYNEAYDNVAKVGLVVSGIQDKNLLCIHEDLEKFVDSAIEAEDSDA